MKEGSKVAAGKLVIAAEAGKKIPEGLILTKDGRPTTDPGEIALDIPELYEAPASAGSSNIPGFLKLPISLAAGGISFPLLNHLEIPWSLLAGLAVSIVTIIVSSVIKKSRGGGK